MVTGLVALSRESATTSRPGASTSGRQALWIKWTRWTLWTAILGSPVHEVYAVDIVPSSATFGAGESVPPQVPAAYAAGYVLPPLRGCTAPMPARRAMARTRLAVAGGRRNAHSSAAQAARPPLAAGGRWLLRAGPCTRPHHPPDPIGGAVHRAPHSRPPHRAQGPPSPPPPISRFPGNDSRAGTARREPHRPDASWASEGASAGPGAWDAWDLWDQWDGLRATTAPSSAAFGAGERVPSHGSCRCGAGSQKAPRPVTTAGRVAMRMRRSSRREHCCTYWRSRAIISA